MVFLLPSLLFVWILLFLISQPPSAHPSPDNGLVSNNFSVFLSPRLPPSFLSLPAFSSVAAVSAVIICQISFLNIFFFFFFFWAEGSLTDRLSSLYVLLLLKRRKQLWLNPSQVLWQISFWGVTQRGGESLKSLNFTLWGQTFGMFTAERERDQLETKYRANAAYNRFYIHVTFAASGQFCLCRESFKLQNFSPSWKSVPLCVCVWRRCIPVVTVQRSFVWAGPSVAPTWTHTLNTLYWCDCDLLSPRIFVCDDFSLSTTAQASSPPRPVAKQKKKPPLYSKTTTCPGPPYHFRWVKDCGGARGEQEHGAYTALQLGAEGSWSGIQVSWHRGDCRLVQVSVDSHGVHSPRSFLLSFCDLCTLGS